MSFYVNDIYPEIPRLFTYLNCHSLDVSQLLRSYSRIVLVQHGLQRKNLDIECKFNSQSDPNWNQHLHHGTYIRW